MIRVIFVNRCLRKFEVMIAFCQNNYSNGHQCDAKAIEMKGTETFFSTE